MPSLWLACSVCFGDPADPASKALVASMIALLGCIGFVLAAIVGTSIVWARRAKKISASA